MYNTLYLFSFCISPHSVQYSVGACTERFAARLSVRTDTHVDHACTLITPVAIHDRKCIKHIRGRAVDEEVHAGPEGNPRIERPNPRGTFID